MKRYLCISSDALPEVYLGVAEAKRLLRQGQVKSVSEAARRAGISRSALYKYRDRVFELSEVERLQSAEIELTLIDRAGALSALTAEISRLGANIVTINQASPKSGAATVTLRLECEDVQAICEAIAAIPDVTGKPKEI